MPIELYAFDWSGTVSNDRMPVYEANMALLRHFEKPTMTFEEWLPRTRLTAAEFLESNGVVGDPKELSALYKKFFDEANARGVVAVIYPDSLATLKYLKERGKKLAVLSSHPAENLRREAEVYEVVGFLDLVVGGVSDKVSGLKEICRSLNVRERDAIYTGDTVFDVRSAKRAGVRSAAVCKGYHSRERLAEEIPDYLLETLSELKRVEIEAE